MKCKYIKKYTKYEYELIFTWLKGKQVLYPALLNQMNKVQKYKQNKHQNYEYFN